ETLEGRWKDGPAPSSRRRAVLDIAGNRGGTRPGFAHDQHDGAVMSGRETAFAFTCRGDSLVAIYHQATGAPRRGVVIVVGGPQYRVGSHRQFVLLARALAESGIPVLRFDYRGMGDSEGEFTGFEAIDLDIAAAIDAFVARCPSLREIVLWGLCDAAS